MKIKPFAVEQWMNEYEEDALHNIAETCVDSISVRELLLLSGDPPFDFWDHPLTYGHIEGSPDYKEGIACLYETIKPADIVSTHGAIGANHLVLYSLISPGDQVISVKPTYQQLYSIPESFGADVKILHLWPEQGFLPDLEELRGLTRDGAKMICINNPNNPSGALMDESLLGEIVSIAREAGAWLLSDEVYRGLNQSGEYTPSIADMYEKGISVCSMSKTFSLAGLRLGWIATKNEEAMKAFLEHRDYNTISCGMLDEMLASLALKSKDAILDRNLKIVRDNLLILDDFISSEPHLSYVKPQAGTTALLYYDLNISSTDFCRGLFEHSKTLLTPGACFDLENCVRIGYACNSDVLKDGLSALSDYLKTL